MPAPNMVHDFMIPPCVIVGGASVHRDRPRGNDGSARRHDRSSSASAVRGDLTVVWCLKHGAGRSVLTIMLCQRHKSRGGFALQYSVIARYIEQSMVNCDPVSKQKIMAGNAVRSFGLA
jgi:hypothetical protein